MLHDLLELDLEPAAAGIRVVISGHTHEPKVTEQRGVVYLNSGSAGPKRFRLPISLARMTIGSEAGRQPDFKQESAKAFAFGTGAARVAIELITLDV